MQSQEATESVIDYANKSGLVSLKHGDQLVIVARRSNEIGNVLDDQRLAARVSMVGNAPAIERPFKVRLCLLAPFTIMLYRFSHWQAQISQSL